MWYLLIVVPWVLTVVALLIIMLKNNSTDRFIDHDDNIFDESETIRVAVYDEKAYWVYDNVFYESDLMQEPDFSTARPIDTEELSAKELNKLMIILDELQNYEGE